MRTVRQTLSPIRSFDLRTEPGGNRFASIEHTDGSYTLLLEYPLPSSLGQGRGMIVIRYRVVAGSVSVITLLIL